jgi:glycosyltransferase involved in cell wall biosynthesis
MYRLAVIPADPIKEYEKKGISLKLREYYNPMGFFGKVYLLSPLEKKQGFDYGMRILPTRDKELPARLKEFGVDIVRAYGGNWPCDMACIFRRSDVPVVVSVHDRRPEWLHPSINSADIVFAVSEEVRRLVADKGKDMDKIWILPNRVDLNVMRPLGKDDYRALPSEFSYKYKILHIGRKSEEKNLDKLILALKYLGSDYCLIAIGRGDESTYKEIASDAGVAERVYLIQQVENERLPLYFSFVDCVCNPSSTEAMSSALIEAMACGAAIVTSDVAAKGVAMRDGKDGLVLTEYNDPANIAEGVRAICENPELKEKLKAAALKSAERYDKDKIDRLEREYYRRILLMRENGELKKSNTGIFFHMFRRRIMKTFYDRIRA